MNSTLLLLLLGALLHVVSFDASVVDTPGNENMATRKFPELPEQLDAPAGHGSVAESRVAIPLVAHVNSLTPPQLESADDIDPVASRMIATFHGSALPCMDAVATAAIFIVFFPNRLRNVVGMLADSVTCTALEGEPVVHWLPLGSSMLRHFWVTDVTTVPMYETALSPPVEAL
jgi:hypothetical protein